MRATKDQRWAAVYGATYAAARMLQGRQLDDASECAVNIANEALAAEPEEAEPEEPRLGPDLRVSRTTHALEVRSLASYSSIQVLPSEAAALARILARFAETGEV